MSVGCGRRPKPQRTHLQLVQDIASLDEITVCFVYLGQPENKRNIKLIIH